MKRIARIFYRGRYQLVIQFSGGDPDHFIPLLKQVYSRRYDLVHANYVIAGVVARSQFRFPLALSKYHPD